MDNFTFKHTSYDRDASVENGVSVYTESLRDVIKAFRDFLIFSGFEYVEDVDVYCGHGVVWSTDETMNFQPDDEFDVIEAA